MALLDSMIRSAIALTLTSLQLLDLPRKCSNLGVGGVQFALYLFLELLFARFEVDIEHL